MKKNRERFLLYGITDTAMAGGLSFAEKIEEAIRGGVTILQLREKELPLEELLPFAREASTVCRRYDIPLIINDSPEIALACEADGVHLGQGDMPPAEARKILGPDKLIGVSARTVEQALAAQASGADYLGCGAVFGTSTKEDAKPLSHDTLRAICDAVDIPVVAIGGITVSNIHTLKGTGIDGAAVVSALFGSRDIRQSAETLARFSREIVES